MSLQPIDIQRIFYPGIESPGVSRRGFLGSRPFFSTLMSRCFPALGDKKGSYIVFGKGVPRGL